MNATQRELEQSILPAPPLYKTNLNHMSSNLNDEMYLNFSIGDPSKHKSTKYSPDASCMSTPNTTRYQSPGKVVKGAMCFRYKKDAIAA